MKARSLVLISYVSAVLVAFAVTENNGDLMYLDALYRHLFTLGRPFAEFVFTEATFLVPDALAYLPLRALAGSQPAAAAAFLMVNLALTLFLLDRVLRRVRPAAGATDRALALGFVALALATVDRLDRTLYWPNHHGPLFPVLLGTWLLGESARGRAWLAPLTAVIGASDGVGVVQVFAPLALGWAWRRNWAAAGLVGAGLVAGAGGLVAVKATHLMRVHTATLLPTAAQLTYQFTHFGQTVAAWLRETWPYHAVMIGALLATRPAGGGWPRPFAWALGVTVVTTLAMGRLTDVYSIRYVLNYFYLGAAGLVSAREARWPRAAWVVLILASGSAGAWALVHGLTFFDRTLTTCVARAVPNAGAHGVAGFWPAKFVTQTGGRTVNQVGPGYTKYLWMNAESWYRPGATFVITDDQLTGDVARAWFGPPAAVETCTARSDVYLYPAGLPEPATPAHAPD